MVKASFFCEIAMVTRGFETRLQILPSEEVRMVRRDGFNHVRDSIWHRHLPIFLRGQDGRVVKAGALGDAHVKSWDQTWSSPDFEKVHIGRCVGFNTSAILYGRRKPNF